ncbi:hypothetical protein ACEPPN_019302 [Leptodophora sp. 'Broadleaf-Isolate-01']
MTLTLPHQSPIACRPTVRGLTLPFSLNNVEQAVDDTMVRDQPSRFVDYLSYDWEEEDIWSSRNHLLSKRNAYGETARLENILWRTWMKSRHRLKTVSAESLDWLKDSDVTWLYGPLQASSDKLSIMPTPLAAGIGIPKANSSVIKKSILKKRSVLETMLQKSLSASSLSYRASAGAAVRAQQSNSMSSTQTPDAANVNGEASGYSTSGFSLRPLRRDDSYEFPSVSSSGLQSLATNSREHVHFNEKVEYWLVVDVVDDYDDEAGIESYATDDDDDDSDSSSDDEGLMMKDSARPKPPSRSNGSLPQASRAPERSTIASLPSTTPRHQEDSPELTQQRSKQDGGRSVLSLPQKTLRASELSTKILLNKHDENADMLWKPSRAFARHGDASSPSHDTLLLNNLCETIRGKAHDGKRGTLFSQVVDAVNSAKDIAFFIWNAR